MSAHTGCDNAKCPHFSFPSTFPESQAIWIDGTYTVCCESCKIQFLDEHPLIRETLTYEPEVIPPSVVKLRGDPFQEKGLLASLRGLVMRLVS
ncbi:MAG: hypothetical protein AAB891_00795 [Patescibacteria group bacterium]